MNILFVTEYYQALGGTEQYLLSLAAALADRGHRISVITANPPEEGSSGTGEPAIVLPVLARAGARLEAGDCAALDDCLERLRPDLVYLHNIANVDAVSRLAAARPLVRYVHDLRLVCPRGNAMYPFGSGICRRSCGAWCYTNTLLRLCLLRPPGVKFQSVREVRRGVSAHAGLRLLVASRYMRGRLVDNGLPPESIEVLPYFCNYPPDEAGTWGDYVLFVGRLVPEKGLPLLLRSMSRWPGELILRVAGEGPFRREFKALAARLGLAGRVDFLGAVANERLRAQYDGSLMVAVPSVWGEPFGIVGLEAMARGKPVVAFDAGGIPEWLDDGQTGFLVPLKDSDALAERVTRLHADRELARRLGGNGRRRYEEEFSRERHVARLEQIFAEEIRRWRA